MTFIAANAAGNINLQATLSASSSGSGDILAGHHPITCSASALSLTEDGTFACEHGQVPGGDPRTQACIDHSIALLIIELLQERERVTP